METGKWAPEKPRLIPGLMLKASSAFRQLSMLDLVLTVSGLLLAVLLRFS